jgi:hypothetical protein
VLFGSHSLGDKTALSESALLRSIRRLEEFDPAGECPPDTTGDQAAISNQALASHRRAAATPIAPDLA